MSHSDSILRLGLLTGELMLKSGAEVYRVEDTLRRLLLQVGANEVETIVTPTGIYLSIGLDGQIFSAVRRVTRGSADLNLVCSLNQFSRTITKDTSPDEALTTVLSLANNPPTYSKVVLSAAAGLAGACFALLFGGNLLESLAGGAGALLVFLACLGLSERNVNRFVADYTGGAVAALSAVLLSLVLPIRIEPAVIGAIMTLVPGVLLTNAVRDSISGDLLSGAARMVEALFVSVAVAGGVGTVLSLWARLGGSL